MIVIKNVQKNEDGSYSSNWQLTEDQMAFLLTFAINTLLAEGLVSVEETEDITQQLFAEPVGGLQ